MPSCIRARAVSRLPSRGSFQRFLPVECAAMCDVAQKDRFDEIFERRRAEAEALWGKKLTIPQEPPRWPPRQDLELEDRAEDPCPTELGVRLPRSARARGRHLAIRAEPDGVGSARDRSRRACADRDASRHHAGGSVARPAEGKCRRLLSARGGRQLENL